MIEALLKPEAYPHPVTRVQLIETHISWVLLTGRFAYKIKKPVELGFVQTGTLQQRLHCCHEELRLNRRMAADLYCAVVPVLGPARRARIGITPLDPTATPNESLLDAAVQMVQFEPQALLSRALTNGSVSQAMLTDLAWTLGLFHLRAQTADPESSFGNPAAVCEPVITNLSVLAPLATQADQHAVLSASPVDRPTTATTPPPLHPAKRTRSDS